VVRNEGHHLAIGTQGEGIPTSTARSDRSLLAIDQQGLGKQLSGMFPVIELLSFNVTELTAEVKMPPATLALFPVIELLSFNVTDPPKEL